MQKGMIQQVCKKDPKNGSQKSFQFRKIGTPTFGPHFGSIWDLAFDPFGTSILESIFNLILDMHFGPSLVPTPQKTWVPVEIILRTMFDGLEYAIFEPFFITFLNAVW